MNKQARNRWGYIPIVAGFAIIAIGIITLYIHVVVNNELAGPNSYFWYYWALVIAFLLIAGSVTTVVGVLISRKISNIFSIALVAGGFLIISLHSYFLLVGWVRPMVNSIGLSNFLGWQAGGIAVGFFSWLMAGVFLVILGIILGLKVKNSWGIASVAGGIVLMILSMSVLILDVATTIAIDPQNGFHDFRWFFFWDNFHPIIVFSLMIGLFFVVLGVMLIKYPKKATAKID
jgi:hypothetical protein